MVTKQIKVFEKRLKELGINRAKLFKALGIYSQKYNNWRSRGIPSEYLLDAAALAQCEPGPLRKAQFVPIETTPPHDPQALSSSEDAIDIPRFNATASMGSGIPDDLDHDGIISHVSVSKSWVRENLPVITSPENLAVMTGLGDSMEPTFVHGAVLFVDTGIRVIEIDAVYVVTLDKELYVKRFQRNIDGSLLMISDNERYSPQAIESTGTHELSVLSRVVGIWNFKRM